jgi:1-aminocyclopropane-1-carboxylate deaminase
MHVDWVVLASSSAGTQAGLIAGFKALGAPTRVMGIAVSGAEQETRRKLVASLAQQSAQLLGCSSAIAEDDVVVNGDYVGAGYGLSADDVIGVVRETARLEALLIDPVYTGKAMLGLYDLSRLGFFEQGESVVFLHTGGTPGLFAYTERFGASE